MNKKFFVITLLACMGVSAGTAYYLSSRVMSRPSSEASSTVTNSQPVVYQRQTVDGVDFIEASKHSTPTVVFIKTEAEVQRRSSFWLFDFDPFGSIGKVSSTGSGVIISEDGYIVTNHHVVKNALKIEVVLNNGKRNYEATVIGTAPSSDLALLKIEAEGLSAIQIANSDEVEIGEWVLAVGNPFNLTSTVTAGIVSAKGRNINLVQNQFPIESFIQTDAAINPGNSGGALVNLNGELVGINTAIASKTGSYVGYGFAIPSNIVVKIINDLKEFGQLQRGFDGLEVVDINDEILDLVDGRQDGVYIARISETNADAGRLFETGDVLVEIDGKAITDKAMYDEVIAYHRPGDELSYVILRDGNRLTKDIKLVNLDGDYELKKRVSHYSEKLRAEFETVSKYELEHFAIESGIRVTKIGNGQLRKMNIPEGFIFTALNKKPATDLKDFVNKLENLRGQIRIEGVSPQGGKQYLSFYAY